MQESGEGGILPRNRSGRKRSIHPTQKRGDHALAGARATESREVHEVGLRDGLNRFTGLTPSCEATNDDKRVESLLAQQMRHTGAGGFALSSTVEVDVFILRKIFDLVGEVVGLEANRAWDSGGAGVVVAVAAHVDQQNVSRTY